MHLPPLETVPEQAGERGEVSSTRLVETGEEKTMVARRQPDDGLAWRGCFGSAET